MQQIPAFSDAFANVLGDGCVYLGQRWPGGNSKPLQHQLSGVQQIPASQVALRPSSTEAPWWPGSMLTLVVTAVLYKIGWGMCSSLNPL